MPVPDYQSLMLPLLQELADGGPMLARQAYEKLATRLKLTPSDRSELLPSGGQSLFENRVGWAKTYMKKAGLVGSPKRGTWEITERGREVLARGPSSIANEDLQKFGEFREFKSSPSAGKPTVKATKKPTEDEATPTEAIEVAHQRLMDELAAELLSQINSNTPAFFERLVVDLMLAMGYGGSRKEAGEATRLSADGGIDGLIREDRLGLDTIYLQAKRWEGTVGRPDVQKFAGALQGERARKGVMISTSSFSDNAHKYVERLDSKIILIDGARLAGLMIDHGVGVAMKQRYDVKVVDGDYFE